MARSSVQSKSTGVNNSAATGTAEPKPESMPNGTIAAASVREPKPTTDQIRVRAYELYQSRAKADRKGDATSDWAQAERELTSRPAH